MADVNHGSHKTPPILCSWSAKTDIDAYGPLLHDSYACNRQLAVLFDKAWDVNPLYYITAKCLQLSVSCFVGFIILPEMLTLFDDGSGQSTQLER